MLANDSMLYVLPKRGGEENRFYAWADKHLERLGGTRFLRDAFEIGHPCTIEHLDQRIRMSQITQECIPTATALMGARYESSDVHEVDGDPTDMTDALPRPRRAETPCPFIGLADRLQAPFSFQSFTEVPTRTGRRRREVRHAHIGVDRAERIVRNGDVC